ncbi:hypothetical protein BHAP_0694 [Bifidobacterium hapali]|uniref:Uncharacterized protein n=1 Tax=Bifidobacterium hapali TaxID=1630172 RepID=A0A261G1A0_9BIFI|nr:hypothetical protein [Bifidobacterium hapali]OZG65190.1 hypothetical protein BHAP_0694 [Bifidobacterium hapali]
MGVRKVCECDISAEDLGTSAGLSRKQGLKCDIAADGLGVSAGMSRFGGGFCDISAGLEYLPPECHILRVGWVRWMGWGWWNAVAPVGLADIDACVAADAVQAVVRKVM